jgi:hypothetical protein
VSKSVFNCTVKPSCVWVFSVIQLYPLLRFAGHAGEKYYQVNPPPEAKCPQRGQHNWSRPS